MQRVSSFEVVFHNASHQQLQASPNSEMRTRFQSWHKTCQFIHERFNDLPPQAWSASGQSPEAVAYDGRTRSILARFTPQNLELEDVQIESVPSLSPGSQSAVLGLTAESVSSVKSWDSVLFAHAAGGDIFENRNVRDFYWELLEGARREVPFRLSFLEKQAELNSFVAHWLSLFQLFKDSFRRTI